MNNISVGRRVSRVKGNGLPNFNKTSALLDSLD